METGTFQIKTVVVAAICLRNRKLSKCAPSISCTKKAEGNQPCQQALAEQFCLMRMELWCGWTWIETTHANNGRKFKSQTSDNMDRWKSRGGSSQRRERQKKEDQRKAEERRSRRAKRHSFPMCCGSGALFGRRDVRKVQAVLREARFEVKSVKNWRSRTTSDRFWKLRYVEMFKKCTPLWQETHFEVKSVKNWRSRTAFGV